MKAREACQLTSGDHVVVAFSNSHRLAQIMRIEWPHFIVHTVLENGNDRVQRSRYQALTLPADYARTYGDYRKPPPVKRKVRP